MNVHAARPRALRLAGARSLRLAGARSLRLAGARSGQAGPALASVVTLIAFVATARGDQSPPPAFAASAAIEQTVLGVRPPLPILESFDGIGQAFAAAQGPGGAGPRNPSDNSLAVGPDHVFQIVNSQLAIFTKKGKRYDTTGTPVYGPVATNTLFTNFGDVCGSRPNGDAVVRYDQLAQRWLVVMPIFRRAVIRTSHDGASAPVAKPGDAARPGQAADPGPPAPPGPPPPRPPPPAAGAQAAQRNRGLSGIDRPLHR